MSKNIMKVLITIILLVTGLSFLHADVPDRDENFIYGIICYDGKNYSGTFCKEDSRDIYLLSNVDNFLVPKKSLIYFWPLSNEWRLDGQTLSKTVEGIIQLSGKNIETMNLTKIKYTFYNAGGSTKIDWRIFKGEDAVNEAAESMKAWEEYYLTLALFNREKALYEQLLQELSIRISALKQAGHDITALVEEIKNLPPPVKPQQPEYSVPKVDEAFSINLSAGEYKIRFLTLDGYIMEGSEKKIIVFDKRRENGIGFQVRAGDKWTRPTQSKTPSSVFYVNGTTDLYLEPFREDEFNDLYYNKMVLNYGRGNPHIVDWIRIEDVEDVILEVKGGNKTTEITRLPFYVQQSQSLLGYTIEPFDPEVKHKYRKANFDAFYVPIDKNITSMKFRLTDKDGNYLPGSERDVRVILNSGAGILTLLLTFLPLLAMVLMMVLRHRKYR